MNVGIFMLRIYFRMEPASVAVSLISHPVSKCPISNAVPDR